MSSWLKALIVLALVVPVTAYVAGSLASSGARDPADRGPVIIKDAPSTTPPTPPTTPTAPTVPPGERRTPRDDNEVRVVTPQPTPVHEDDEDNDTDDRREGDDDDSRDGDDTGDGDDDGDTDDGDD